MPGHVDPFIATGGNGFNVGSAFPGATAPNGLASASPDTIGTLWGDARWLHCSGYWSGDDTIQGFSNLHMYGTGVPDYGVLALMPLPAFDPTKTTKSFYGSPFKKKSETSAPGYYAVTLDNGNIKVELTATPRATYHRYTFANGSSSGHVIFDLAHTLDMGKVSGGSLQLFPADKRIRGSFRSFGDMSGGWGYPVHFEARVNAPWKSAELWSELQPPATGTAIKGDQIGADLEFDVASGKPIEITIGISMVSEDAAAANLSAEIPGFDFDGTRAKTKAAWDAIQSLAKITGGTTDQETIFMTALYHAFVMPAIQTDTDGSYVGFDMQIHKADGYDYVSNLSLWDTYRTLNPLYSLIAPSRARDVARSLVEMGKEANRFPKWSLADGDANSMVGAGAEVVLADAWLKGITDFDAKGAYAILRAAAMEMVEPAKGGRGGREDVVPYMQYGYIPSTSDGKVSVTLEYSQDDFALGNLAAALGEKKDADALLARRLGYRKLFDPQTGFLRGRLANGNFTSSGFDPVTSQADYVEANAWQSLWVPHDIEGMISLFGSRQAFVDKLQSFFEQAKTEWEMVKNNPGQRAAPRPFYWAGNEPDIHAVYMFAQAGRPDLTQKWVKWIMANFYGTGPDGIPGNDDGGTMSAWYIFSSLGIYPLVGTDRYTVGAPMFPHIDIAVAGGRFTIDTEGEVNGLDADNLYVQSVTLNGQPLNVAELHHADLKAGGSLKFKMGKTASSWGVVN